MKTRDKIFYKLGYVKPNPFGDLLVEVVRESLKRNETITLNEMGLEVDITARDSLGV